jgi:LacI family transcriptional regulator
MKQSIRTNSRATLKDVARLAGVHPGTASRALREDSRHLVNAETLEAVSNAAKKLGYRINPIARGLRTSRSYSIGILIPDISNPLFPPIVRGIEDRIEKDGYTPLIANTENDPIRERSYIDGMLTRQVDGLIAATATQEDLLLEEVVDSGVPLVLANRRSRNEGQSSATVDDAMGAKLAVEHLAELGHRDIAHVAGPTNFSTGADRYQGFLNAMNELGLQVEEEHLAFASAFTESEGERCMGQLLRRRPRPTAVMAANDLLALGCYDALAEAGLACPADVSVIGFNDMPFADRFSPALTTIRIPQYEIGQVAANLLIEEIQSDSPATPQHVVLKPSLVVRASTAAPRALVS